ncbi:dephospho-CoA kinase [Mangrovimonas xylaniphaga]|uniref:dephospho-CoA kinase n=1 Tax=Mangrovimonas xylaniphaga TaxID=1645915 RepID=UPI0006B4D7FE|nr:dephospho-CoA kinase [Mangrovimonas xylaniphaga]
MKVIGVTGGIGSGKSTVANMFRSLGIPVYTADMEAKRIMATSPELQRKLKVLFGEQAYVNGELNRPFIADAIFNNKALLEAMNAIVHPEVAKHFKEWLAEQSSPYVIKEAAIIFEQHMEKEYDAVILVIAGTNQRIERLLKREDTSREKIQAIMDNQFSDDEKLKLADYIIVNDKLEATHNQVIKLHETLLSVGKEP